MSKKYYWLKLKNDFFEQKEIKKLRKIAGGDTYTIIYLKMQLLSLKTNGKLFFDGLEDTFIEEIALTIDEVPENVSVTLAFLQKCGLVEQVEEDEFILPETISSIGSESESAPRVRRHREKDKALQCNDVALLGNGDVTKCNTEIEKELEKEKEKKQKPRKGQFGEYGNVLLTDKEVEKLIVDYGLTKYQMSVTFLDEYIEEKGYKSKNHNLAIRRWVIEAIEKKNTNKPFYQQKAVGSGFQILGGG